MFDIKKHANGIAYKIVISYDAKLRKIIVSGYSGYNKPMAGVQFDLDGEPLLFDTMDDAMASITEYPDK